MHTRPRRLRPTLLLQTSILAGCIALVAGVWLAGSGTRWALTALALAVVLWVVGIELGLLPLAIERFLRRRAARRGQPVSSVWFVDVEVERAQRWQTFHDDTEDNPTIR